MTTIYEDKFSPAWYLIQLSVEHPRARPQLNSEGIVLAGLPPKDGFPPLLLIWDEGPGNPGASATNCVQDLLLWAQQAWPGLAAGDTLVFQRDSDGEFYAILTKWCVLPRSTDGGYWLSEVNFVPLRWPGAKDCSQAAFSALTGARGAEVLALAGSTATRG